MSDALQLSYGLQLAALAGMITSQWQWPSPDSGFALHVFKATVTAMPFKIDEPRLPELYRRRLAEGPILAAVGYLIAEGGTDQDLQKDWAAGLARLAARQPFPRDRESFFYRPLELLGICLGLGACGECEPRHRQWVLDVVKRGADYLRDADLRTQLLGAYAAHAIGVTWHLQRFLRVQECGLEDLGLIVWLQLAHPGSLEALGQAGHEREYQQALLLKTALAPVTQFDISRAAVQYVVLTDLIERFIRSSTERYWQSGKESRDAVELVRTLCSRFHLFAMQLQKRHKQRETIHFEDEYDIQDALHALLRLHFDDVRAEEWTPSYGGNASRIDFLLKREQVIVETKVTRTKTRKLDQREIANQLIIDKERYRTHPDCKTLVCFVYDPDNLCDNVAALTSDLSTEGPPLRVVVVAAPTGT